MLKSTRCSWIRDINHCNGVWGLASEKLPKLSQRVASAILGKNIAVIFPNLAADKNHVIDLLVQVTYVSVEIQCIAGVMRELLR